MVITDAGPCIAKKKKYRRRKKQQLSFECTMYYIILQIHITLLFGAWQMLISDL